MPNVLDTFRYNGATTTLDTLWMSAPVVALRGERGISRSGYSIMQSLGAPDLIALDPKNTYAGTSSWPAMLRDEENCAARCGAASNARR